MFNFRDSEEEEDIFDSDVFNKNLDIQMSHTMSLTTVIFIVGSVVVLLLLLGCCCRRKRYRGHVIAAPAVVTSPPGPVAYPQQQYAPAHYPVPVAATNVNTTYPAAMPTPYPTAAPYPTGAPYPTEAPAPYPHAAPYPQVAPYPQPQPFPTGPYPQAAPYSQPTAPDAHALPPTYEQAVGHKDPPYNPQPH